VLSHSNKLTERIIGLAIEVHRELGPGLLESAYEECLCSELRQNGLSHERQVPLPVVYKSLGSIAAIASTLWSRKKSS
jgi:GxxExxY protein